ncbi:MAG: hypothetical protein NVS3B3_10310 [Aquirhabdus sp.]
MKIFEHVHVVASRVKPKLIVSMMLLSISSAAVLSSQSANAAVYKKVDADGNVSFSDVPDKSAKLITVAPLATVPAMSPELIESTLNSDSKSSNVKRQENYTLTIISPTPDQVYRRSEKSFSPSVQVKPDLTNGDRLITLVDGKPSNGGLIEGMDRGEHQFEAKIVNANGRVLISKSVSFNVLQSNVKQQQRMGIKH